MLADLDAELGRSERFAEPPPLTNRPRSPLDFVMLQLSRLNWRVTLGVAATILFVILAILAIRSRTAKPSDPLKDLPPGVYQPKPGRSGDTLPLPPGK